MSQKLFLGTSLFLLTNFCSIVLAGPPFFTDDPVPVERKHTEIYFASTYVSDKEGISGVLPLIDMNYGILPEVHAHVSTLFNYNRPKKMEGGKDSRTNYGYGDTELGFKWRLIHETDLIPQMAIYPAIEIPTGSSKKGLGEGRSKIFLPVWLQKGWGQWTAYGGGGYWINRRAGIKNSTYLGVVIQRDLCKRLSVGGEIFFRTRETDEEQNGLGLNLGGQMNATENHHFLLSVGTDVHGPNHVTIYLAYQLTF